MFYEGMCLMLKRHEDCMNVVTNKRYKNICLNWKLGVSTVQIHVEVEEYRDQGSDEKLVTELKT